MQRKKSKVKNVKPKVYAGVQYKSSLEAFTAKALAEEGLPVNYESISFPILSSFTCPGQSFEYRLKKNKAVPLTQNVFGEVKPQTLGIKYTPDFVDMDKGWLIEVKGVRTDAFLLRWKLFRKYLCDRELALTCYMPNNQAQVLEAIAHIKKTFSYA